METKVYLIRHAQTDANLKKRYSGSMDICLNATGKKQARRLYRRLKSESIVKVYSSDKKRAVETARITFCGRPVSKSPDLREMHFGVFEGLNYKEMMKGHASICKKWFKDPFSVTIPEGENLRQVKRRVVRRIKKIVSENPGEAVAVVSHGGAISLLINHILKTDDFWKYIPDSASLTVLEFNAGKADVCFFNDTSFL